MNLPPSDASRLEPDATFGKATEDAFERVLELARRSFGAPLTLLSFVTEGRQSIRAAHGLEPGETSLEQLFSLETLRGSGALSIPDTHAAGFQDAPWVSGAPFVRAYLGVPLTTPSGEPVGVLSVMDSAPRDDFQDDAIALLCEFAALVRTELELQRALSEARRSAAQTHTVLASIAQAFFTLDGEWRFTSLNDQAETMLKHSRADLLGRVAWDIFPEIATTELFIGYIAQLSRGEPLHDECFFSSLDNWLEIDAYHSGGGIAIYLQNISERKASEARAEVQAKFHRELLAFTQKSLEAGLSEHFYQNLLEVAIATIPGAQAGSLLVRKGRQHHFAAAVGYDLAALQTCIFDERDASAHLNMNLFEPQHVYSWPGEELSREQRRVLEGAGRSHEIQVSLCVPIAVHGNVAISLYLDNFESKAAFDSSATIMAQVLAQQAATLMQRLELEGERALERAALARLAHYDPLTDLPNRYLFEDRLGVAASQARRTGTTLAVLFIDLDRFKDINETHGHSVGDALITAVAARLRLLVREGDTLARWGGDEFIGLFPDVGGEQAATRLARRVLQALDPPFELEGLELDTEASIGIALYLDGSESEADIIKNADIALFQAKQQRGQVQLFSRTLKQKLNQRVELGKELRSALSRGDLTVHYQPRVDLLDGEVTSFEALARWPHPTRGYVPPCVFIPLAEESGLIHVLGAQVLEKACQQAKRWQQEGQPQRVAVNLSVEQLKHPGIVAEIESVLTRNKLDAQWLELEITESTAMSDVDGNIGKLQQLRDIGVRLAIDDFSTAYSSLAYIEKLPVHCLKIDRSFLFNITTLSTRDTRVVEAVLALARSFGLSVIAEGVETEVQRQTLLELGCHEAQGYLFAAPMDAARATAFLLELKSSKPQPS